MLRRVLEPQGIIDRNSYLLLGAEIALSGLNGGVSQQELDLLQIAAALPAELRAGLSAQSEDRDVL